MNYCHDCGAKIKVMVPPDDDKPRHVCSVCGIVHYENPKMVVGTIPHWEDKILLCKRAIEPGYGRWTLPAGYLELGESLAAGARRETEEEAGARLGELSLYSVMNLTHIGQIYFIFRAPLLDLDFKAGVESLAVELIRPQEIIWPDLAFSAVKMTLEHYLNDMETGLFPLHMGEVPPHRP